MAGIEASLKRAIGGINPWMPLFAFVGLFQYLRGAYLDTIYFLAVVLILWIDWKRSFPFDLPKAPLLRRSVTMLAALGTGVALYLSPEHGALEVALMFAVFMVALALVWHKDSGIVRNNSIAIQRSRWLWIILGVLISLWELFAYILSDVAQNVYAYPTISVLMDPIVSDPIGRAAFVAGWLTVGVLLTRGHRRK